MSFLEKYLLCALGIVISIILPILRASLPHAPATRGSFEKYTVRIWRVTKPYLILGLFSLATGLIIVALAGNYMKDWGTALLAGYAWDSTLQKFRGENKTIAEES